MSSGKEEVERVRRARCLLERMRERLLRPSFDALDACAVDLDRAVECLRQVDLSLQSPIWRGHTRQKIESEVVALRRALRSVQELLKNAGKFYAGLAHLLAPDDAPANYTSAGALGTISHAAGRSVVLQG